MATLAAQIERPSPPAQPQQGLALTYHRLMLVMFLFVGVTFVIVARLAQLQLFTDRAGSALAVNPLLPPRGDIVDRNGLAAGADLRRLDDRRPSGRGDRRQERAGPPPRRTDARSAAPQQYFAMLNDRERPFIYLAPQRRAGDGAGGERAGRAGHRLQPRAASGSIRRPRSPAISSAGSTATAMALRAWSRRSRRGSAIRRGAASRSRSRSTAACRRCWRPSSPRR